MDEDREDALARIRFLAAISHNSAPPHCHPVTILLMILSVGIIFIGMTMTIVAHWPGSVSVGFDPLSVPGPIILAFGGALFILSVLLVWYFNVKEKNRKKKKLLNFALSRPSLNMSSSSKHHHRSLDYEPKSRQRKTSDTGVDEPDDHLLPSTGDATTETTSSPHQDIIPEPRRNQAKSKKNGQQKMKLTEMAEVDDSQDSDQLFSTEDVKRVTKTTTTVKQATKKKKINTNYSRDNVLANFESRKPSEADDPSEEEQPSLRVHVKVPQGANVNIYNI